MIKMEIEKQYYDAISKLSSNREGWELLKRTTDALVLGFTDPIRYDIRIPKLSRVHFSAGYAIENYISGKPVDLDQFKKDADSYTNFNPTLEKFMKSNDWAPRTAECLFALLYVTYSTGYMGNGANFPKIALILEDRERFRKEFIFGFGECYDYREGKRDEANMLVNSYFKPAEVENFKKLHHYMRLYTKQ